MNATIEKFGYPRTLIAEYDHWVVLLREKQVTAGCLILACKDEVGAFSAISQDAFAELKRVTTDIETSLAAIVRYERINYLMLMMVDPHVHFHVIPRHGSEREVAGIRFVDGAFPKPPDLATSAALGAAQLQALQAHLSKAWHRDRP
ncbi:MAG TPA: HIT domain-containing protein [Candidatus Binatia bacterium]|nr:HIT domain-containing protein [Candidatus Binatia bacterium]